VGFHMCMSLCPVLHSIVLGVLFVSIGHVLCLLCCMVFRPFCVSVQLWYGVHPEVLPH
jgi:hypothetical protein